MVIVMSMLCAHVTPLRIKPSVPVNQVMPIRVRLHEWSVHVCFVHMPYFVKYRSYMRTSVSSDLSSGV